MSEPKDAPAPADPPPEVVEEGSYTFRVVRSKPKNREEKELILTVESGGDTTLGIRANTNVPEGSLRAMLELWLVRRELER